MPKFTIWFNETELMKMSFEADNLEHAKELLNKVIDWELDTMDLPDVDKSSKDFQVEFDMSTLRELKGEN